MPQRNGKNPIKAVKDFGHGGPSKTDGAGVKSRTFGKILCLVCKTEIPPKPGFRTSSLKCPKCGASRGNK